MGIKKFYFDVETTGVNAFKNAIHQIAFIVEINGKVEAREDWKIAPFKGAVIEPEALKVGGVTEELIFSYPDFKEQYKSFIRLLSKYIDRYNRQDKFHLVGYNNRYFDDRFLRAWFERCGDQYFGSWFWADSLDVMVLASQHLLHKRHTMKNFKLSTVAETLGIQVEEDRLHDGLYDVEITRDVYNIISASDLL